MDNLTEAQRKILRADDERKAAIVADTIRTIGELVTDRSPLTAQCEEIASLIRPSEAMTFFSPGSNRAYIKKTGQQVDSTGMVALSRFTAICDSMLTPKNTVWHGLEPAGKNRAALLKDRATKVWFYDVTRLLFSYRYTPSAGFVGNNQSIWTSLGAYGNGAMFGDSYYDFTGKRFGLRYKQVPFGQIYFEFNHQGVVDGFIRMIRLKAYQAVKVPEWQDNMPVSVRVAAEKTPMREFIFLHRVMPRDAYKPWMIDNKNMPYASFHICMDTRDFISESGYRTFPLSTALYQSSAGEEYARSPAMDVLPSLKTLNEQKKTFLTVGHRAANPVLLLADDGIMSANLKPGALNRGGISADGKKLIQTLETGDVQITEVMMAEEKQLIDSVFMVDLFNIALERKSGTTATEVIDEINKRGILIAPTLGRQEDYLSHQTDRDLSLLGQMGVLPPMPPLLREAKGEYKMQWLSPLAKAMRAGEVSGFFRSVEMSKEVMNITGDPSVMDPYDFDAATPDFADINGAPVVWMASPDKIAAKRQARAQAAQQEQQVNAAPGAAALISANAKATAAGSKAPLGPGNAPAMRNLSGAAPIPQPGGQ